MVRIKKIYYFYSQRIKSKSLRECFNLKINSKLQIQKEIDIITLESLENEEDTINEENPQNNENDTIFQNFQNEANLQNAESQPEEVKSSPEQTKKRDLKAIQKSLEGNSSLANPYRSLNH